MESEIEMKPVEVEMTPVENAGGENTSSNMKQTSPEISNDIDYKDVEGDSKVENTEKSEDDYVPAETMNSFGVFLFLSV